MEVLSFENCCWFYTKKGTNCKEDGRIEGSWAHLHPPSLPDTPTLQLHLIQLTLKTTLRLAEQLFPSYRYKEKAPFKRVGGAETQSRTKTPGPTTHKQEGYRRSEGPLQGQRDQSPHQAPLAVGTCTGKLNSHKICLWRSVGLTLTLREAEGNKKSRLHSRG